ncbi:MAG: ankyrin repeat domain-containing protein [Rickettsia endosymbiont of Argas persicus]
MWKFLEVFFEKQTRIKIDKFKQLPSLHSAVKEGNISDVRICLHRKCDLYEKDSYGNNAWYYAFKTDNKEIIEILEQYEVHKLG